jgi:predicted XRE-type DNA-binding protein
MPNERTTSAAKIRGAIATEVRAELARQQRTQREIGAIIGLPQASVQMRLKGITPFRAEELVMIADAIGVPISRLIPDLWPLAPWNVA